MATAELPGPTLAFLQSRPETAARVFNELDPEDAAALLETIPGRLAGPIVGRMAPYAAARCIELLSPDRSAGTVRGMAYLDSVSVLRLVSAPCFEAILEQLPKRLANEIRHSLTYPRQTVGANMDPRVDWLDEEDRVADALKIARRPTSRIVSHIFLVGTGRRFVGAVRLADLLRSDPNTPLSEISDHTVRPLSNRARLANVVSAEGWDEYPILPVVGRKNNLLGGLSRKVLREKLAAPPDDTTAPQNALFLSQFVGAYLVTFTGLLRLILKIQPPTAALEANRDR